MRDPSEEARLRAAMLIRSGRAREALPVLTKLVATGSRTYRVLSEVVYAHRSLGEFDAALTVCNEMVQAWPDDPACYALRAGISTRRGQPQAAIDDYEAASRLQPDRPGIHLDRGRLRMWLGQTSGAIDDFSREMKIPARTSRLAGLLNRGQARYVAGNVEGALADLSAAADLELTVGFGKLFRGYVFLWEGHPRRAADDFTEVATANPSLPNVFRLRAIARLVMGDRLGAASDRDRFRSLGGSDYVAFQFANWDQPGL